MKLIKEIIISGLFFVLYAIFSFAVWLTDQSLDLVFIMLVGIAIILFYFAAALTIEAFKEPRRKYPERMILREYPEEECEDKYEGFRTLFSENKNGGKAT